MKFCCNGCNLGNNIKKHRMMLDNLIVEKSHKLLDEEIISLSQVLDSLVCECVLCRK